MSLLLFQKTVGVPDNYKEEEDIEEATDIILEPDLFLTREEVNDIDWANWVIAILRSNFFTILLNIYYKEIVDITLKENAILKIAVNIKLLNSFFIFLLTRR